MILLTRYRCLQNVWQFSKDQEIEAMKTDKKKLFKSIIIFQGPAVCKIDENGGRGGGGVSKRLHNFQRIFDSCAFELC